MARWGAAGTRRTGARTWTPEHRENLAALMRLLPEEIPDARWLKAEAARELGDFAEALRLLGGEFEFPPQCRETVAKLRALCEAGDCRVAKLFGDAR